MQTYNHNFPGYLRLLPVLGGSFIALAATFILRLPNIWALLVTVGLAVFVLSFAVRNFKSYWLGVFALTLPLHITKLFSDADHIREMVRLYNISAGEFPGWVVYLSDLPFIVLMLHWLFAIIYKRQKIFFPKSNLMALFFIGWAGLSLIKAPMLSYAFFDFIKFIKLYFVYLYIANNIRSKSEAKTLITFFLVGVVFQGLICLYQYMSQDISYIFGNLFGQKDLYSPKGLEKYQFMFSVYSSASPLKRGSGTVGPINAEAQYFEFLLPVALILWLTARRFWSRSFNLSVFSIGFLGLIVTFSRGGLIGIIAGIIAVLIYAKIYKLISNKKLLAIVFTCLIAGTAMFPSFYQYIMSRPEAAIARFGLMKVGMKIIIDNPIMGVGLNNQLIVAPKYDPDGYFSDMPTHNHYLVVASEIGIPGLVFLLGFLIITCRTALKTSRSKNLYIAALSLGIFGAYTAISAHALVDWLATYTNQTFLWLYGGLIAALSRLDEISELSTADLDR
ncbi:hypothetical protein AMJ44_07065 [candidate division WOR-1 bacterium DG_54_3]|uniref:O-antigen ligase-related domain-containing protein n=1 Tax=candidate division WOR-1 bacterium DG_54_3 TaxID=1703775 RepID=A0A0S7XZU2_UNCSA|nr:MAG: hypothetical protein AMJ44_07065 [candidate division WOR-1 bacterium DG_54_3]